MQNRQVEAAAVPRDDLRRVFFDAVKKALNKLCFAVDGLAERPDAEGVAVAQRAGNRHHSLQMQLNEIVARGLPAALERHGRHLLVADLRGDAV